MTDNQYSGQVMRVNDFVDYQSAGVVSRALVDREVGTVTFFAFDKGEGLSEHTAPYDALVVVTEGAVDITIDGKMHRVEEGDMLLMPANRPHGLVAVERFKMMLVMIRG